MLLIEALYLFTALLPACLKNTENKCLQRVDFESTVIQTKLGHIDIFGI